MTCMSPGVGNLEFNMHQIDNSAAEIAAADAADLHNRIRLFSGN